MTSFIEISTAWLDAHPLPLPTANADKNSRGRVLLVGGARFVPGALALTGEAVLRAGAGKVQMATVEAVALALGVLVPEAAMIALPMRDDGEIARDAVSRLERLVPQCDLLLIGPGMSANVETRDLVNGLVSLGPSAVLLDAAALTCMTIDDLQKITQDAPAVATPHQGEMAALADVTIDCVRDNPATIVAEVAHKSGATIALKGPETWIADATGALLRFEGNCPGLATGGSGDVLAGVIGGLVSRGVDSLVATAHGVAAHSFAGHEAASAIGPLGFLARDLLPLLPRHLSRD